MKISVVIPVLNGAADGVDALLRSLREQTVPAEVLVVDSGSSDGTPELIRRDFPEVKLLEIPNREFQHGRTRNWAARQTNGELIVFTVQDAVPANERWLESLTAPFADPLVVAAHGPQIPRRGCNPTVARDIEETYRAIESVSPSTIHHLAPGSEQERAYRAGGHERDLLRFYSDVNSCLRRNYWVDHPYPEVDYAEDQLFGQQVLENGFKKAYVPAAGVIHSHDYPLLKLFGRTFDDYRGLDRVFGGTPQLKLWKLLPGAARAAWRDIRYVSGRPNYRMAQKLYWSHWVCWANVFKRAGIYLGSRHRRVPAWAEALVSLEMRRRRAT